MSDMLKKLAQVYRYPVDIELQPTSMQRETQNQPSAVRPFQTKGHYSRVELPEKNRKVQNPLKAGSQFHGRKRLSSHIPHHLY
jgi:hypothetical protein